MQNRSRISKGFMLPLWVLVSIFLIQGSLFGATPPPELGDNLVINGDFEQGNTGFVSEYNFVNSGNINDPGEYAVDYDVNDHYNNQGSTTPMLGQGHSGKYMMVNGSGNVNHIVWQETIEVTSYTNYTFSVWVAHLWKSTGDFYKAKLKFYINDQPLNDDPFINDCSSASQRPNWKEFSAVWNSCSSNTATITIYNLNPSDEAGNDFGLDDISFRGELVSGSIFISRVAPICAGTTLDLTPPELPCEDCSGQWEVLQGDNIVSTPVSNTISNVPIGWNGCLLRYAVNCQGVWFYSNAVPLYVTPGLNVDIQIVEGNSTICEGDTVHLHANVTGDVMDFDFIRVGDILCTDGSIVHPGDWASSGKTAKGIVFYVDETDVHGWAVGLTEKTSVKWSKDNINDSVTWLPFINAPRDAIHDYDGYVNTNRIRALGNETMYPAAWYCYNEGGYLPSIGQLNILYGGVALVNSSLELVGGIQFPADGKGYLWSSTIRIKSQAYCTDWSGQVQGGSMMTSGASTSPYRARPVFDF